MTLGITKNIISKTKTFFVDTLGFTQTVGLFYTLTGCRLLFYEIAMKYKRVLHFNGHDQLFHGIYKITDFIL